MTSGRGGWGLGKCACIATAANFVFCCASFADAFCALLSVFSLFFFSYFFLACFLAVFLFFVFGIFLQLVAAAVVVVVFTQMKLSEWKLCGQDEGAERGVMAAGT